MDKKALAAFLIIGLVATITGAGLYAYFSDTETSTGNTFTAGTLDLKTLVGGSWEDSVIHLEISNIKPGWSKEFWVSLKNVGTLTGKLSVEISTIVNDENGRIDPEIEAGDISDYVGELGDYLLVYKMHLTRGGWHGTTRLKTLDNFYAPPPGTKPLNQMGGKRFYAYTDPSVAIMGPSETRDFVIILQLPSDVGNIVQSDKVQFDITFRLEQVL
jgi:predicted ribosomally synthesized peptide with SipW-like signal peptide